MRRTNALCAGFECKKELGKFAMISTRHEFDKNQDYFWIHLNTLNDELKRDNLWHFPRAKFVETAENRENAKRVIIALAERLYESVGRDNSEQKIEIINRRKWENVGFDEIKGVYLLPQPVKYCSIKTKKQAQLLILLIKIYNLLSKNVFVSKRALYYEEKDAFNSQSLVDELIDDICCITSMKRYQLHIFPSTKGLIAGNVFLSIDYETFNVASFKHGFPIPSRVYDIESLSSTAKFILLVEKESIFSRLMSSKICERMPVIMITGRGYPDSNTREIVNLLWRNLQIPILALVDADPHGIEIMCVYKYGSLALAFANDICVTRQIKWLGIHPTDICRLNIPESMRLPFKNTDRVKMFDLSQRPYMQSNPELANQLLVLSRLQVKAEIECLTSWGEGDYLVDIFIPQKIKNGGWI